MFTRSKMYIYCFHQKAAVESNI